MNAEVDLFVQGSWNMMEVGSSGPSLWSAEEPHLYILVLSLIAPDGSHLESESCQVNIVLAAQPKPEYADHALLIVPTPLAKYAQKAARIVVVQAVAYTKLCASAWKAWCLLDY